MEVAMGQAAQHAEDVVLSSSAPSAFRVAHHCGCTEWTEAQ